MPDGIYDNYFDYSENGQIFQIIYPGEDKIRHIAYDRNGRVDKIQDSCFPDQYWDMYNYDNNGNVTGISSWWGYEDFIYDDNNRLSYWGYTTLGGSTYNEQYTYDSAGNVTQIARSSGGNSTFTYNNADQITSAGFTYDNRGNLTYDGVNNYTYDTENRLTNVSYSGGSATYTYYANGLRKSKSVNGTITNYHYDNFGNLVRESNSSGATKNLYCYSPQGKLLCENINGSSYFVHDNYRGDVITLTDEDGDISAQYYYDPWGNQLTYSDSVTQPFRYAGYYYDAETGLYYCKGRYYSPRLRRFLTRDSVGNIDTGGPQTLNLYSYVGNNPVNYTDPTGEMAGALALGAVGGALSWSPVGWVILGVVVVGTIAYAQNNKQLNKKISGFEKQIKEHLKKLKDDPNSPYAEHWKKEIKTFEDSIKKIMERLKRKRG